MEEQQKAVAEAQQAMEDAKRKMEEAQRVMAEAEAALEEQQQTAVAELLSMETEAAGTGAEATGMETEADGAETGATGAGADTAAAGPEADGASEASGAGASEAGAEAPGTEAPADEAEAPKKEKKKIIVVDDIAFHLVSIKERLKSRYEIYPAQSAQILFNILQNITPDLILLDVNMPDVDGFELVETIKAEGRLSSIPIIFLTAKKDKESERKAMALGAADYVTKPFADADLIARIEKQLSGEPEKMEKPVVLAVDDSPSILQSVNHLLQDKYTVYTLPNPLLLSKLLLRIVPDLFLLDYQMPGLTGFELVPIIRNTPPNEDTPIVFLTSENTTYHVIEGVQNLGAKDFILKPIDEALLRERIEVQLADFAARRRKRMLRGE